MGGKIVLYLGLLLPLISTAQQGDYFLGKTIYPFINYQNNQISTPADSNLLNSVNIEIDQLIHAGKGKLNIVHIGGSHIQADIYTHQIRKRLQTLDYNMNGGRGFIFPYKMAQTNNPSNYSVDYSGDWDYCKNTQSKRSCTLGLSGITVYTADKSSSISINPNIDEAVEYTFDQVRIYHSPGNFELSISDKNQAFKGIYDSLNGCTVIAVPEMKSLHLTVTNTDTTESFFELYGISLDSDNPGIVYNTVGVNGAKLDSYLSCEFYSQHLASIQPDIIIFSIGTNDGNTRYFNQEKFRMEYIRLIEISKIAVPNAKIIITVPNDCYLFKKYVNKNTALMRDEINRIAKENNYGVWDLYTVMGGLNSSQKWYSYGLMQYDRIHFNREGYLLKGDLFVTAFLKEWERNLEARSDKKNQVLNNSESPTQYSQTQ